MPPKRSLPAISSNLMQQLASEAEVAESNLLQEGNTKKKKTRVTRQKKSIFEKIPVQEKPAFKNNAQRVRKTSNLDKNPIQNQKIFPSTSTSRKRTKCQETKKKKSQLEASTKKRKKQDRGLQQEQGSQFLDDEAGVDNDDGVDGGVDDENVLETEADRQEMENFLNNELQLNESYPNPYLERFNMQEMINLERRVAMLESNEKKIWALINKTDQHVKTLLDSNINLEPSQFLNNFDLD